MRKGNISPSNDCKRELHGDEKLGFAQEISIAGENVQMNGILPEKLEEFVENL